MLICQLFLMIGYCLRHYETYKISYPKLLLCIIVYVILAIISIELYPGAYFDIKINLYYNQVITLLMIFVYSARLDQLSRPIRSPETLKLIS